MVGLLLSVNEVYTLHLTPVQFRAGRIGSYSYHYVVTTLVSYVTSSKCNSFEYKIYGTPNYHQ